MRKIYLAALFLSLFATDIIAQNLPFPQRISFAGCITPIHKSASELDLSLTHLYDSWKNDFLKETLLADGYYVHGDCTGCSVESKGTSEGHGYGMIITALMAGYDPEAKTYFDGLYYFFDQYRSQTNAKLMNWNVAADERDPWTGSATDGDMDIAYGLLLAHYQWGSDGNINYLEEAIDMINDGLKVGDMHASSKRVMLGDWDSEALSTRPSDWMTGHFRAYAEVSNDDFWLQANDTIYSMIKQIQSSYSSTTGLLSDFVIGRPAKPSSADFLEGPNDGNYYYNACRFPWRIASDYLHFSSPESKESLSNLLQWANGKIEDDFNNYTAGFTLEGEALNSYTDMAFTAPLVLAFCTDSSYQQTLNLGWKYIEENYNAYFDASINLLCQLMITGNWWAPISQSSQSNALNVSLINSIQNVTLNQSAKIRFTGSDTSLITKVIIYEGKRKITSLENAPFSYDYLVTKTGTQNLKVQVESNIAKHSIQQLVIQGQLSSSKPEQSTIKKCYPNPVKNELNITLHPIHGLTQIELYNLKGQLQQKIEVNAGLHYASMDLAMLLNGFYILQVKYDNGIEIMKILKH